MKVSLNWLREFVALPANHAELVDLLTLAGVEVEEVSQRGADYPERRRRANPRIRPASQRRPPQRLQGGCRQWPDRSRSFAAQRITASATRFRSRFPARCFPAISRSRSANCAASKATGMMCSAKELGLGEGDEGLLILPPDAPVGRPIAELFPADVILDLEITPNRPDLLSHYGIAREIAALRSVSA